MIAGASKAPARSDAPGATATTAPQSRPDSQTNDRLPPAGATRVGVRIGFAALATGSAQSGQNEHCRDHGEAHASSDFLAQTDRHRDTARSAFLDPGQLEVDAVEFGPRRVPSLGVLGLAR